MSGQTVDIEQTESGRIEAPAEGYSYVPWPADDKPHDFEDLCDPVIRAIRFAYKLERKNKGKNVPWNGPSFGIDCAASCLPPHEALRASRLKYAEEDQGRDPLVQIISLALQLGIEQGRRITMSSPAVETLKFYERLGKAYLNEGASKRPAQADGLTGDEP